MMKSRALDDRSVENDFVVEGYVIDSNDPFFSQNPVIDEGRSTVKRMANCEVRIITDAGSLFTL